MRTRDAVLFAALVVLVVALLYYGRGWLSSGSRDGFRGANTAYGNVHQQYPDGRWNPYTVLHKQLDTIRGYHNDGFRQPPFWRSPKGLDRYHRSGASMKPEMIAEAEREQWYAAAGTDQAGHFNTELVQDPAKETFQYHTPNQAIDYGSYITDLIVDPRTKDNHERWVEEMKPWSGTAMAVDDLEEAQEATVDFIGLRRPQAVVQYNPLQLTERDTYTLSGNAKFNFKG